LGKAKKERSKLVKGIRKFRAGTERIHSAVDKKKHTRGEVKKGGESGGRMVKGELFPSDFESVMVRTRIRKAKQKGTEQHVLL